MWFIQKSIENRLTDKFLENDATGIISRGAASRTGNATVKLVSGIRFNLNIIPSSTCFGFMIT